MVTDDLVNKRFERTLQVMLTQCYVSGGHSSRGEQIAQSFSSRYYVLYQ